MMGRGDKSTFWPLLAVIVFGVLLVPAFVIDSALALPPRPPTPTPTVVPAPVVPSFRAGGSLLLHVRFPATWPGKERPWQTLWTVIQWQDDRGIWRDVEGWRGTLDGVEARGDGTVVGWKTWWVAERDLGTGPFRWRVYAGEDGPLLAESPSFQLPVTVDGSLVVEVFLNP